MYAPPNAANKKVLTTTVFHTLCYCHKIGKLRIRQWMYESTMIYFCPLSMIIPASSRPKSCILYLQSACGQNVKIIGVLKNLLPFLKLHHFYRENQKNVLCQLEGAVDKTARAASNCGANSRIEVGPKTKPITCKRCSSRMLSLRV